MLTFLKDIRPIADVPVHPHVGELWGDTRPFGDLPGTCTIYPKKNLYGPEEVYSAVLVALEACLKACDQVNPSGEPRYVLEDAVSHIRALTENLYKC